MNVNNHTWFPALAFRGVGPGGEGFQTVVLRQTFAIVEGGLAFAREQSPLCERDLFMGEPNRSSVREESDLCPFKPRCDVLATATAHAPAGQPARSFLVNLRVWRPAQDPKQAPIILVDKSLRVSGPSQLRRRALPFRMAWFLVKIGSFGLFRRNPWKRTRPEPILELPVRYEYAYGGENRIMVSHRAASRVKKRDRRPGPGLEELKEAYEQKGEDAPVAWTYHKANAVGMGFAQAWFVRVTGTQRIPAPQIEAPSAPVTAAAFLQALRGQEPDHPAFSPQGLGLLAKGWVPRRYLVGTVDEAWVKSGKPLPDDFAFAIWNGAPLDQQVPHLSGDESIECTNLCPPDLPGARRDAMGNTVLRLDLPGHLPYLLAHPQAGPGIPFPLALDTVNLDLEQRTLVLIWRLVLPEDPPWRLGELRMVHRDQKAEWLRRGGPEWTRPSEAKSSTKVLVQRRVFHV